MRTTKTVRVELQIGAMRYVDVEEAERIASTGNFQEVEPEGVVRVLRELPPPGWVPPLHDRTYVRFSADDLAQVEWRDIKETSR